MMVDESQTGGLFDDRRKAAEALYGREQELEFLTRVRLSKLLARWAAARMGLGEDEAQNYAVEIVASAAGKPESAIRERILADFANHNVVLDHGEFDRKAEDARGEASRQIRLNK